MKQIKQIFFKGEGLTLASWKSSQINKKKQEKQPLNIEEPNKMYAKNKDSVTTLRTVETKCYECK